MANHYVKVDPYNLQLEHLYPPVRGPTPLEPPTWMVERFRSKRLTLLPFSPVPMSGVYRIDHGNLHLGMLAWDTSRYRMSVHPSVDALPGHPPSTFLTVDHRPHSKPSAEQLLQLADFIMRLFCCHGCNTMRKTHTCPHCRDVSYCSVGCLRKHRSVHELECIKVCMERSRKEPDTKWRIIKGCKGRYHPMPEPMKPQVAPRNPQEWRRDTVEDTTKLSLLDIPRDALLHLIVGELDQVMRCMLAGTCTTFRKALKIRLSIGCINRVHMDDAALVAGHVHIFERLYKRGAHYQYNTIRNAMTDNSLEVAEWIVAHEVYKSINSAHLLKDMLSAGRGDVLRLLLIHHGVLENRSPAAMNGRDRCGMVRALDHVLSPLQMRKHVHYPERVATLHQAGLLKQGAVSSHLRRAYDELGPEYDGPMFRLRDLYGTTQYLLSVGFLTAKRARIITNSLYYQMCRVGQL